MPEFPRLTIVTPSFNQAIYLEQTICSVLDQAYPNLEYIIVDGGSSDDSVELIKRYEKHLAWWVSEPDRGQAEAINKGMARATGEFTAWINSDDYYLPGAFEQAVKSLQEWKDAGLVFGDVQAVNAIGKPIKLLQYGHWGLAELMSFHIIGQPGVFMRRSVFEQAGGVDEQYHYMLDHQLWLRIASRAQMVYVPETWAAARYHNQAKNIAQPVGFGREAYQVVRWMENAPEFAHAFSGIRRRVWAGVHRYNGWYLSEGGQPWPALQAYWKSLISHPGPAIKDWKRIAATVLMLAGIRLRGKRE
jgi:glycosyltransferase involved in cell wall biosynthesis